VVQPKVTAGGYGLRTEEGWDAGLDFLETYQRTLTHLMKTMVLPEGLREGEAAASGRLRQALGPQEPKAGSQDVL